jgi:predicted ribosomally synthesized peptide with nif11-like leader
MSQENALTFIRKVYQDPSLQAKVRPLANNDMDALLKIAVGAGFDFTVDDFLAAQVSANTPGDDIADDDLDVIAGGQRSGSVYTILCTLGCQTLVACSKQ